MARSAPPLVDTDEILGLVRYCFGCQEWWPSDEEFWRPRLWTRRALCRACALDRRRERTREATRRFRSRRRDGQAA